MSAGTGGDPLDLVGVGFGPSNLALAIALAEQHAPGTRLPVVHGRFVERKPRFGWHTGMLLDDATMQVAFLKDLATMRNPTSSFGFVPYLHERGRLVDFVNHKTLFPSRREFHDYLEWAAGRLADVVDYGCEVVGVEPVPEPDHGPPRTVDVVVADGATRRRLRTGNVVLGVGLRPVLPDGVSEGPRVWHSNELLPRLATLPDGARSFVVVGAGQSAAEVAEYLHTHYPRADVHAVFSRYGYSPADDSPFANRIFDPAAVEDFHAADDEVRRMLLDYHSNTNYSVVDLELIDELYRRQYQERVRGTRRLHIEGASRVVDIDPRADLVRVAVEHLPTGTVRQIGCDALIYATGFAPVDPQPLLGELARCCVTDTQGRLVVDRDYRVRTTPELRCGIYLQGGTEHTHGISSSLLSNAAVRAGEIADSVRRTARTDRHNATATELEEVAS